MKISTKGRYGLLALLDLAIHSKDKKISLKEIASRQKISESYLEQIIALLRKGGIINSQKGPNGGYYISRELDDITLLEVLETIEGDLFVIDGDIKTSYDKVLYHEVWYEIDRHIKDKLKAKTLKDLVREFNKQALDENMYYI